MRIVLSALLLTCRQEDNSPTLSNPKARKENTVQYAKEAFDWNCKTKRLLGNFLHVLSETVETWTAFRSPDGDCNYLTDSNQAPKERQHVQASLRTINDKFESLKAVRRALLSLNERCSISTDAVSSHRVVKTPLFKLIWLYKLDLQLTVESNEAVRHTIFTAECTILVGLGG